MQTRLHLPADQQFTLPESPLVRTLYDCPDVPVGEDGQRYRLVVAIHPKGPKKQRIGVERDGLIYELFLTKLPQEAFTASDVMAVYLHRGSFETVLSDEDCEQEPFSGRNLHRYLGRAHSLEEDSSACDGPQRYADFSH